jgi:guanylate kinase
MKRKGLLLVVSSPSGGGKTTICEQLLKKDRNLMRSISVTTREPRGREKNGRDYYYIDMTKFQQLKKQKAFLEWAQVHGHCYGTLRDKVENEQRLGKDVLLVIDVQGGLAVKKIDPRAVLVFVQPPTLKALQARLQKRGTDDRAVILERLQNARWEMAQAQQYDYVVVNERLPKAVANVQAIITAERLRVALEVKKGKKRKAV